MNNKSQKVSNVLLDFIFGGPMAQPEVIGQDTENAWQAWTDAMTARDAADDVRRSTVGQEHTQPMPLLH